MIRTKINRPVIPRNKTISPIILLVILLALLSSFQVLAQEGEKINPGENSAPVPAYQNVQFEYLTTEDGLSSDIVWSVLQDSHGFIWIGTLDGLNRYDGINFKIYRHNVNDANSLSDNPVQVLYEDRDGMLWIGSYAGGLTKFDPETEQFSRYQFNPNAPQSLSSNQVRTIYEDQGGILWVGTVSGLNRLDRETNTFIHYKHDPDDPHSLSHDAVFTIYEDRTGALWIGTNGGGLDRFDRENRQFIHFKHDPDDPNTLSHNSVGALFEDRDGVLWIGTNGGGLNRFDPESEQFSVYQYDPDDPNSLSQNFIQAIYEDQDGVLWVGGSGGGLNQFDRDTGKFIRYQYDPRDPYSLSHNGVKSIYEDREGTLWISTIGGGANRLDRNKKQFVLHRNNPANPDSLISNDVRAIGEDHTGAVWIGTMGGLDRFDRQVDPGSAPAQFTHYRSDPSNPRSLSHNSVLSIVEDQLGMMWFGTLARGLDRFDHQTGQFIHYQNDPDDSQSLSHNIVRSLYVDSEETLWVGTFGGGLNRFDSQEEKFIRYQHDPDDPSTLSDNTVMAILEDNFRELWIGTLGGLNRFDRGTGEFVRYNHDPNDQNSLSHDNAVSLFEDQAGVLWIGTNGGGLNKFDRQNEQFIHYTEVNGLPSGTVMGITEDDQGYLWLSTSQGLSKFDPHLETFRNYDTYDGLQGNQFNFNSLHKSGSGELFFGGVNGFNSFYPANIQNNAYVPPVVITDFQLANKPVDIGPDSVLQKSILETDKLALSYEDQVISFEFAALNYMSPEKNRYRYTLEGFDEEWTEVGSDRRFVTYTNLDPGEYVFRVIGSNNDGIWNEEGASINITIIPPWWDTAWFRGLALLLLVGIIYGTYRWRVRNVETRSQELEAQVVEKTYELNERVKELNCLYGISRLAGRQGISLEEILQGTLELITPSFQFPEGACARIILDDQEFKTGNFEETPLLQTADILVRGKQSGSVEVRYLSGVLESDEGLFLEEERDLISAIAGRLGRIIERKQAEEALSRRVEELAMLNKIAHTLANMTELQTALHTVVETITKIFDYAITNVSVLEDDHMIILAQYEREPGGVDMVGKTLPLLNIPSIRQVLESGESRVVSDVQAISLPAAMDTVLRVRNIHALMIVPLRIRGIVIGILFVGCDRPGRDYSSAEVGLTEIIAVDIAGAIENARLYDQAQETAVDSERQRLARELHDSVTQSLYTTSLIAETLPGVWERHPEEALRSLEDLRQISKGALAEMRTLLLELRPGELAELKLDELLGQLTVAVSARTNLPVTTSVVGNCDPPLDVQIAFYRIAQEALNNISKHAHAKRAWVNLHCSAEGINLRVRDDGRGFDPDIQKPDQLGLSIMRERAQSIGAVLSFESQPDIGTEVSVKWVVPKKEQVDE